MEIDKTYKFNNVMFKNQWGQVRLDPLWDRLNDGSDLNKPQGRFTAHFIPEEVLRDSMAFIRLEKGVEHLGHIDFTSSRARNNFFQALKMGIRNDLKDGD